MLFVSTNLTNMPTLKFFSAQFQKKILIKPNFEIFFQFIAVFLTTHQDNGVKLAFLTS